MSKFLQMGEEVEATTSMPASESQPSFKPAGSFSMKNLQKAIMTPKDMSTIDVPQRMAAAIDAADQESSRSSEQV